MTMTDNEMIQALEEYAHDNYNEGGHWIYECWEDSDYQTALEECGSLVKAKDRLKAIWKLKNELSTIFR